MAYLVSVVRQCDARGCGRRASHQLFDVKQRPKGYYCEADGKLEKKKLDTGRQ